MKKRKKAIIITVIVVIIISIGLISYYVYRSKDKTHINDFSSIKEIVQYDGHQYIKTTKSSETGYDKDIYITFNKPPINEDGTTNRNIYEILISHIAGKLDPEDFRIIDENKNLIIKIKVENNQITTYTINGDSKYWEHIKTSYQIENEKKESITNITIKSSLLNNIINQNWIYNNVRLGNKQSTSNNYEIYYENGYKIRKIGSRIYNIVFTTKYQNEIAEGITTSSNINDIEAMYGIPTYSDVSEKIYGYKTNNGYIFITDKEISVYPLEQYNETESSKFANLVTNLNTTGESNTFINKLTDLYSDYETFYKTENYINIIYPLRGFTVTIGASKNNGITLYSNFAGQVTNDVSIDTIKNEKKIPQNVYTKFDTNLVFESEIRRKTSDEILRNPYDNNWIIQTDTYTVQKNDNEYNFYSRDKENIDSAITVNNLTNIVSFDEVTFIYGIKNKGIYAYNAQKMQLSELVTGNDEFNITKYENNKLYYDNKEIDVN